MCPGPGGNFKISTAPCGKHLSALKNIVADMKIFPTEKIKQIDRYTIEHEPIASVDLMERAATAITREITERWDTRRRIVVFAGAGNNGGDALAVARMLTKCGYHVECFLFNPKNRLSPDCEINRDRLRETNVPLHEVMHEFAPPRLDSNDIVIDGLFGSGLQRPLDNAYAAVVQYINASGATIVSIDMPSGMMGEDNRECLWKNMIHPHLTLTLQFPKLAFFIAEDTPLTGHWKVLDIGLHPDIIEKEETPYHYLPPSEVARWLKCREKFSNKYDYGHLLVVAGSRGMAGAAVLASRAALHSGAGLVSIHSAACCETILQTAVPEAMFQADTNESHISDIPVTRRYDSVAIGPGLGRDPETREAYIRLLAQCTAPIVVDADALNLMQGSPTTLNLLPKWSIITPHQKEFDRLFGESRTPYDRLQKALEMSNYYHIIIVLKGAHTAIVSPDGNIYFNGTGNPGMATAGSGDTLTGIIGALLCQHYTPLQAAIMGVTLHGMAGDIAANRESQEYITAGDISASLGRAFAKLHAYKNIETK